MRDADQQVAMQKERRSSSFMNIAGPGSWRFHGLAGVVDSRTTSSGRTTLSAATSPPSIRWSSVLAAISPIVFSGCRTVVNLGEMKPAI
jgi:hypothetical protein